MYVWDALQCATGASHLRYSKATIWRLYTFVGLYTALIVAGSPSIVYGQNVRTPLSNWCHVHIVKDGGFVTKMAVLMWIVLDMAISMTLLFLFQRPITHLIKVMHVVDKDSKLTYVATKAAILSWSSILCAVVSLILYLWKHIATLIELNVPFSCFCVVLMPKCAVCAHCAVRARCESKHSNARTRRAWRLRSGRQHRLHAPLRAFRLRQIRRIFTSLPPHPPQDP